MLTHLHIKNFTIIDELSLEIPDGLNIITGETGAGKSILIDALELILGERLEAQMIREGENRCEISACFDLNAAARAWLEEHDFNSEECIIHRVINRDVPTAFQAATRRRRGRAAECINEYMSSESSLQQSRSLKGEGYSRSRLTINGTLCTLQQVKELAALLIHIHGQHQHQMLLKRDYQTQILDEFAEHRHHLEAENVTFDNNG